ncbi:hypothetical protein RhiirA4_476029 [Rhizophagus irregularis]|uniref:Uncharacterized protein n=1 Tax=Rhizophagus irregularis TaxID=588596 RepID=A0A2I1HB25_9GLOM|nr:hypothetical protein RhiirA4_476029 [Rhizophagus irregularis]
MWELLRRVYNENFNKIPNRKDYKKVIENLWGFCYDNIKSQIWLKRCDDVAEIEKDEILKIIVKLEKQVEKDKIQKNNFNKKIKLVTKDRMIGRITEGISIKKDWHTIVKLA